jgi:hypothetical protein
VFIQPFNCWELNSEDCICQQITLIIIFLFLSSPDQITLIILGLFRLLSFVFCPSSVRHPSLKRPLNGLLSKFNPTTRPGIQDDLRYSKKRKFFNWLLMLYHKSKWVQMLIGTTWQFNNISVEFHCSQRVLHDLTYLILRIWAYLNKVIPQTINPHYIWFVSFYSSTLDHRALR